MVLVLIFEGDFNSWLLCTKGQSLLYLFEGNFPQLLANEEERREECKKNGFASGVLAAETSKILSLNFNCISDHVYSSFEG